MKLKPTFVSVAEDHIKYTETRVHLGERSATFIRDCKQRLPRYCTPFFGKMTVDKIDAQVLEDFRVHLVNMLLSSTSILAIESFVRVVLRRAARKHYISHVPEFPEMRRRAVPRPAFSRAQYEQLLKSLHDIEKDKPKVEFKGNVVDWQLRNLVTLMVHTFTRPADLFAMKNKHIEIVPSTPAVGDKPKRPSYLRMNLPSSKGHNDPIISMPDAVHIYRTNLSKHGAAGFGKPDDYVFFPDRLGRRYAQEIVTRQFHQVLAIAGLSQNAKGQEHSLYSLRHTAIMFRLLYAEDLDLLTLARAARTSVEVIDRFYAKSLTAEMNRDRLHSNYRPAKAAA